MEVVKFKNISRDKRFCSECGNRIYSRGDYYITRKERGKYLCHRCEEKISSQITP